MKLSSIFYLSLLLTLVSSCKVDELTDADLVSGEAEFAIPIGTTSTTIEELLDNFDDQTTIEFGPDDVIHLIYRGEVLRQTADEYLLDVRNDVPPIIPMVDTNYMILPFSSPNILEVDKAIYKTGQISIAVSSLEYQGTIELTVVMPEVTKNGEPLTFETSFESPKTGPLGAEEILETSTDVSDYVLVPVDGNIHVEYEAITENGAGEPITLDVVALVSTNIYFGFFEGYLGRDTLPGGRDTIEIDFFENWSQGDVYFEDPKITINIENSFGVPTRSVIDTFDILTADGQRITLESEFINNVSGIDFAYPETPGEVSKMSFEFTKENSNIDEVLGSRPVALDYKVDARMNPDSIVSLRGFITDSSYYNILVEVDLPLYGWASGFGVTDEFDIDFDGYDEVLEAEFKLVADNGMPLEIDGQAYFLDGTGAILDSLFSTGPTGIVGAAEVDLDGNVIAPTTQTSLATFGADRFQNIRQAKTISLTAFFSTYKEGQQSVKALKGQETEIRMGLKVLTE